MQGRYLLTAGGRNNSSPLMNKYNDVIGVFGVRGCEGRQETQSPRQAQRNLRLTGVRQFGSHALSGIVNVRQDFAGLEQGTQDFQAGSPASPGNPECSPNRACDFGTCLSGLVQEF